MVCVLYFKKTSLRNFSIWPMWPVKILTFCKRRGEQVFESSKGMRIIGVVELILSKTYGNGSDTINRSDTIRQKFEWSLRKKKSRYNVWKIPTGNNKESEVNAALYLFILYLSRDICDFIKTVGNWNVTINAVF